VVGITPGFPRFDFFVLGCESFVLGSLKFHPQTGNVKPMFHPYKNDQTSIFKNGYYLFKLLFFHFSLINGKF